MSSKYQVMPDLTEEEYQELKSDIEDRGVMVPIEFDEEGNCLDGHHRLRACEELGIKDYPRVVRAGMTEEQKYEHALLANVARRNLTNDNKRQVAEKLMAEHPEFSFQRIADILHIGKKTVSRWADKTDDMPECATVSDDTVAHHIGLDGKERPASEIAAEAQREAIRESITEHPEKSNRQIAREIGASDHTVARQREAINHPVSVFNPNARDAEALKDPDIQRRLAEDNKLNVAGAIREQKREQVIEHLESVETKEAKAVAGVYDVIVVDPPWPMQKIEMDNRPLQANFDYPVMTLDEIKQLEIPAADDCHLFLWTTQRFLKDAFSVLESWGFRYICTFVWHKTDGYKPIGLPKFNCEFALYARKGTPVFVDEKQFWVCFDAPNRGHSVKPDEFYDLVRRITAGRRLDMFNRRKIEGFDVWGKEACVG